jgi:hypothetical protein
LEKAAAIPAALCAIALLGTACPKRELDAKQTCTQFLNDVRNRRGAAAFEKLSEASQTELRRRHLALIDVQGGDPDASPAYLIFRTLDIEVMSTVQSIAEASRPDPAEVLLRVAVQSGKSADIRMVREGEGWKVDLFGSLSAH